jgi:hypothetical protein
VHTLAFCQWAFGDLKNEGQNTFAVSLRLEQLVIEGLTLL